MGTADMAPSEPASQPPPKEELRAKSPAPLAAPPPQPPPPAKPPPQQAPPSSEGLRAAVPNLPPAPTGPSPPVPTQAPVPKDSKPVPKVDGRGDAFAKFFKRLGTTPDKVEQIVQEQEKEKLEQA